MSDTEAQSAPETVAASDDVRADVQAAIEALQGNETAQVTDDTGAAEKAERARNERGQFAKADGQAQADPVAKPVSDADPVEGKPLQPSQAAEAPTSWSADAKATWSALPSSAQQTILKREAEMNEAGQRWSEEKRRYEETIAPVRAVSQRNGVDEREGLNRLLAANDFLERSPAEAIQWLAKAYGVDLGNLNANPTARPQVDPTVSQLQQKVSSLEKTFEERQHAEVLTTIDQFKASHEHFDEVRVDMGQLIKGGMATDMEDAYQKAIWANPAVREKMIAAQTAGVDKARQQQAQVDKARRGAISVSGSPIAGGAPVEKREYETVEDAAKAAWAQHMGA